VVMVVDSPGAARIPVRRHKDQRGAVFH
jgi:hypothetical protein